MEDPSLPKKKQKIDKSKVFTTVKDNASMKEFYKLQLNLDDDDFESFWSLIKNPLPVTFRVNPTQKNYQAIIDKLTSSDFHTPEFQVSQIS